MSLMGELNYLQWLQNKQLKEGTFVCQTKYCQMLLKCFEMVYSKSIDTQMPINGNLDKMNKDVDFKMYRVHVSAFSVGHPKR